VRNAEYNGNIARWHAACGVVYTFSYTCVRFFRISTPRVLPTHCSYIALLAVLTISEVVEK